MILRQRGHPPRH